MTPLSSRTPAGLLLAFVVFLTGCTLGTAENDPGGGAINITSVPLIEPAERVEGPEACGVTLQGEDLCVADLTGTPTLVNFWASWCGPCATEVPELVEVATAYEGRVDLVGVNIEDTETNARSFERDQRVNYPSLYDRGALIAAQFGGIAPEALPSTILLDADGRVAVRLFGAVSQATLVPYLEALLEEAA